MRHCYVLRVFTREGAGGNHLGVVTDTTGLSPDRMQSIAAGLGFSETVFIDWREGGIPRARIFTPSVELPFAGHPLVGAGWVLNVAGPGAPRLECGLGMVDVAAEGETARITVPAFEGLVESVAGEAGPAAARAAGLDAFRAAFRIQMPSPYLLLEAVDPEAVSAALPDFDAIAGLADITGVYLHAGGQEVRARFFAPALGVPEDPATGSAAVALAAVRRFGGVQSGAFAVRQGDEMGHPSLIRCRWERGRVELAGAVAQDEVRVLEE